MASSAVGFPRKLHSLEDLLICPVCLDSLQDPRTLACLHTFCTNCLEGCRKLHRRDFECPVCKRLTSLSMQGIQGLPIDHRIQQIRDIVNQSHKGQTQKKDGAQPRWPQAESHQSCDLCRAQQRSATLAACHCIQCFMYFCDACTQKHDGNPLCVGHDKIMMQDSSAVEMLFCRLHKEQPVRYFCKVCRLLLCTVCTIVHDPSHQQEALEKGIIEKYKRHLEESLVLLSSKLKEVNASTKCLETLRQSHQSRLYQVQSLIRERAEHFIAQIRRQERELLEDAQQRFDARMRDCGMEQMADMIFFKTNLELLHAELQQAVSGSPQMCLLRYSDLMARFSSISETSIPTVGRCRDRRAIRFVPSSKEMDLMIGSLQEICMDDELDRCDQEESGPQSPSTSGVHVHQSSDRSIMDFAVCSSKLRNRTILNAVSPGRKDVRIGRLKSVNKSRSASNSIAMGAEAFAALSSADNVPTEASDGGEVEGGEAGAGGEGVGEAVVEVSKTDASSSAESADQSLVASPSSTTNDATVVVRLSFSPKLLFRVEQVGGMPGKITYPSSVAFLPDGNIVVAECEHRLQIFDRKGQSVRVIGWGKIRPQGVVVTTTGLIACTDKKEQTVKMYSKSGDLCESWPNRMFGMPSGIAMATTGNFVISDVDRSCISTHCPRGSTGMMISRPIGVWPDLCQRFGCPAHVAVDCNDNIFVSDTSESSVQMFDKTGKYVLRFALPISTSGSWHNPFRPQGLSIDGNGNVAICDIDNHRVSLFSPEGVYLTDLLTEQNGLKYPCNVAFSSSGSEIAVVESHGGILTNNPHHAVKIFSLM